jgi:hypothetical protein
VNWIWLLIRSPFLRVPSLLLHLQGIDLSYACSYNVPAPNWIPPNSTATHPLVSMIGSCSNRNITITTAAAGSKPVPPGAGVPPWVMCDDICYVSLGTSTYVLFASLILSLVYMFSLVLRYHRLAKIFRATQRTLVTEMEKLLSLDASNSGDSEKSLGPSSRDVVLAMLAKS